MSDKGLWTQYRRETAHRSHENRVAKWWCARCHKYHGATVDRIKVDDEIMCFRQWYRLLDAEKEAV